MVKITRYIKYISITVIFFVINSEAMNIGSKTRLTSLKKKSEKVKKIKEEIKKAEEAVEKTVATLQPGEYFVHATGEAEGEVVLGDVLKQSEYFKNWLEMKPNNKEIPITGDYSSNDIKILCNALKDWFKGDKKKVEDNMQKFLLKKSVEIANMFTFFDVPEDMINIVLNKIKIDIGNEEDIDILANLNPDLQKSLLMTPAIAYLKSLIIKAKNFNKPDVEIEGDITALVDIIKFNSDGTKIIVGGQNKLILWDISNLDHIVSYDLNNILGLIGSNIGKVVTMVAFSQDGNRVVAFGHDMAINSNRLVLWDIYNLKNITVRVLANNIGYIQAAAFSLDGSKIATGGFSPFKLWNLDLNTNTIILPTKDLGAIGTMVFSLDGNKIGIGGINEFRLVDITDLKHLKFYPLGILQAKIYQMAISPNGDKIVAINASTAKGELPSTLVLCDIKDLNLKQIVPFVLMKNVDNVSSLGFSPDGAEIFLIDQGDSMFTLLNISDLNNIIRQSINIPNFIPLATDGNKIILGRFNDYKHLFLVNLLTEAQKLLMHNIKNYSSDQIRLIYKLCLRVFKNQKIQSDQLNELEKKASEILPAPMHNLLQDIGCFKNQ